MSGTREHTCKYDKQSQGEHERWPPFTGALSYYHLITSDGRLDNDVYWLDLRNILLLPFIMLAIGRVHSTRHFHIRIFC